jgi:Host cell surface-exposed lipoprotein/Glucodextranase, domain B
MSGPRAGRWWSKAVALLVFAAVGAAALSSCGGGSATAGKTASTAQTAPPEPPVDLHLDQGTFSQTGSTATLTGTVTPGASVTVDERSAVVRGQKWRGTVHLNIGENHISVKASLAGHQSAENTVTVYRHHTQAELEAIAQARHEREEREKRAREEREEREKHAREAREQKEREAKEIAEATPSQQNALQKARSYLESESFSEAGLIEQLSSEAGEKFPHADAVWAVEHLHVNWNEQALKKAKSYLESQSFSCEGLVQQLSSEAGEKFTASQAEYAAHQVGLC